MSVQVHVKSTGALSEDGKQSAVNGLLTVAGAITDTVTFGVTEPARVVMDFMSVQDKAWNNKDESSFDRYSKQVGDASLGKEIRKHRK